MADYNKQTNKQTHRYREQIVVPVWGRKWDRQDRGSGLRGTNYYI